MPSVARAYTCAAIENSTSGMVSLLGPTAISAFPTTVTIPGTALTGMRLIIRVFGHTATGTISIAGTAPGSAAAVTETSPTLALVETSGEFAEYVSTGVYGAINAGGITVTGLTSGAAVVYGVQAAKSKVLSGEVKITDKYTEASPKLQRGVYAADYHLQRLATDPEWEFSGPVYADNNFWAFQSGYSSNVTYTTIPASPLSVLSSTSVATGATITAGITAPTAPGMILLLALGGTAPATAASISVTGTNFFGETITEVVVPTTKAQGTYYSINSFQTITNFVNGAFGTGATLTVTGVFGWAATTSTPMTDNLATMVLENYDSAGSYSLPYCVTNNLTLEGGYDKEAKITAKGPCQGVFNVGDITNSTAQIVGVGQTVDEALIGYEAVLFFDNASGTIGTTSELDCFAWKIDIKDLWKKPIHTSQWNPPARNWSRIYRGLYSVDVEFDVDLTQAAYDIEYLAFKQRRRRLIQLWMKGPVLGVDGSTMYFQGFKCNLVVEWVDVVERDFSSGKDSVQAKFKGKVFYDPGIGYTHQFTWYTRSHGW